MKNKITYNKLIRDRIPEIIESTGKRSKTYIADESEYKSLLLKKLIEEAQEMMEDPCIEELADIMEVIESIKDIFGYNDVEINEKKLSKQNDRGGFKKRIILEYVYEE